jgi:hypothetical protein
MQCFNQISVQLLTVTYEFESRRPRDYASFSGRLSGPKQILEFHEELAGGKLPLRSAARIE